MSSTSEIPPPPEEATDAAVVPPTDDGSGQIIPLKNLPAKKLRGVAYPYAIKTKWTKSDGLVKSPYAQDKQLIDVSKYAPGDPVRCPHTGKIFIVP
ncbi:MAG: hypothetical protein HY360_05545 [Verrucomicrobia bacterium]|nr:hypothetical protein [Verrucomicrobiota bacterium]